MHFAGGTAAAQDEAVDSFAEPKILTSARVNETSDNGNKQRDSSALF